MLRVGMTYDLREDYLAAGYGEEETAEFDSPATIAAIEQALAANGVAPVRIGNVRDLAQRLAAGERWDFVFNICEGLSGAGREAHAVARLSFHHARAPLSAVFMAFWPGRSMKRQITKASPSISAAVAAARRGAGARPSSRLKTMKPNSWWRR